MQLDRIAKPIDVNSVVIDEHGELERRAPKIPFSFSFRWRGTEFEGRVQQDGAGLCLLLKTELGTLPYSAENANLRSRVLAAIEDGPHSQRCGVTVTSHQTAELTREVPISAASGLTAIALVTNVAIAVLGAAPYLDLLSDVGLQPA